MADLRDEEFRALLDTIMEGDGQVRHATLVTIRGYADREAKDRGYRDWADAYHRFEGDETDG